MDKDNLITESDDQVGLLGSVFNLCVLEQNLNVTHVIGLTGDLDTVVVRVMESRRAICIIAVSASRAPV